MNGYRYNSTFKVKESRLKRSGIKRSLRPTLKKKREPPALTRAKRIAKVRDDYTCQYPGCGRRSKHIDAHHKAKRSQRPDLKFDPDNLICLCREHHDWTDH